MATTPPTEPAGDATATRHASWGVTLACIAVLVVPLVVAAVALHGKPWFPTGDLAQAQMRLVGFWSHPPLIGPAGRIGTTVQGSHPGPLMFWFAWPVYRLLGNTSWGYEVSVLVLAAVWIALIAVFARRRGGLGLLLTLLAGLAIVARSYHADTLSQPWNPFMPLLAFFLFLVLVWSVLCDDLVALPGGRGPRQLLPAVRDRVLAHGRGHAGPGGGLAGGALRAPPPRPGVAGPRPGAVAGGRRSSPGCWCGSHR